MGRVGRIVLVLAVAAMVAFGLFWYFVARPLDRLLTWPDRPAAAPAAETPAAPIYFLSDIDFDTGPVTIVLHELATGTGPVLVTDQNVLRAAKETAFYTDDPEGEGKLLLMSLLFLSPPGNSMDDAFVSIYRNGRLIARDTCFKLHCQSADVVGVKPHRQDIAALLGAGVPVTEKSELFTDYDAYLARIARVEGDPRMVFLDGPPDPVDPPFTHAGYWQVSFPSQAWLADGQPGYTPFDAKARAATLDDWLASVLVPFGDRVQAGPVRIRRAEPPFALVTADSNAPVSAGTSEEPLQYGAIEAFLFDARVEGDSETWAALRDALRSPDGPRPASDGPGVTERLRTFVATELKSDCTTCFFTYIPGFRNVSDPGVYEAHSHYLVWYEPMAADGEDSSNP